MLARGLDNLKAFSRCGLDSGGGTGAQVHLAFKVGGPHLLHYKLLVSLATIRVQ